ncbi:hypothetical protein [Nocardia sp. CA-290969]|uniref:hypothetical protein n=1 Tax=Nocardia sp. CA-290969 TaxID=3239986 RepID=UPI003D921A1D
MADVSFSAHITVDEETDIDGLPILTATVTPDEESAQLPLPAGPAGPVGPTGSPRTTFLKMGEIANAAARPGDLTAEDRGKWWHRLDTDGMDFWTGTTWVHSPGAVGPQGLVAPATTITPTTTHSPALTTPAVRFTGDAPALNLSVTAPAGLQGPEGPPGDSGSISTATDFDTTTGPAQRGIFTWAQGARKWKVQPAPNGFGMWSWWDTDFNAATTADTDRLIAGTFALPDMPFAYRPMAWGRLTISSEQNTSTFAEIRVRIGSETGPMVAAGAGIRTISGSSYITVFSPSIGDSTTKPISPTSTLASVPAYTPTNLLVTVERIGQSTSVDIGFNPARASLTVWAQPIG